MNSNAVEQLVNSLSTLEVLMPNTAIYLDLVTGMHCTPKTQQPEPTWVWVGYARDLMFLHEAKKVTNSRESSRVLARQMAQRHINSVLGFQ